VQAIDLEVPREQAFAFIADPAGAGPDQLPGSSPPAQEMNIQRPFSFMRMSV
jgi:hypothetical protein